MSKDKYIVFANIRYNAKGRPNNQLGLEVYGKTKDFTNGREPAPFYTDVKSLLTNDMFHFSRQEWLYLLSLLGEDSNYQSLVTNIAKRNTFTVHQIRVMLKHDIKHDKNSSD